MFPPMDMLGKVWGLVAKNDEPENSSFEMSDLVVPTLVGVAVLFAANNLARTGLFKSFVLAALSGIATKMLHGPSPEASLA